MKKHNKKEVIYMDKTRLKEIIFIMCDHDEELLSDMLKLYQIDNNEE